MAADVISFLLKNDAGTLLNTFSVPLNKMDATAAPSVTDDDAAGYVAGSMWVDRTNNKVYVCQDNATGAAVWAEYPGSGGNIQTLLDGISTTTGALLTYEAGDWVAINPGTAGYVLTSNGAGNASTYQAIPAQPVTDADYGDITVSVLGTTWTIDNGVVTYAKIQNVSATDKLLGRSTAGAGVVEEIACTAFGRSLIDDAAASNARTTLGATTVGGNMFTLTNPSAVSFPRFNADNTVDALSASGFRTAIGAGTGSGTVTSVAQTVPSEMSISGSPVTTTGTLAITWASGSGSKFIGTPSGGGAGAYAGRALVVTDLPLGTIILRDEKSSGTNGGTFTSGAWRTRTLNTESYDGGGFCSLASDQFTLTAGTYAIRASAPAAVVDSHQAKLYNATDASDIILGSTEYTGSTIGAQTRSIVVGVFTIAASKALELRHQCQTTRATNGLGVAGSFGTEVYTEVFLQRIA